MLPIVTEQDMAARGYGADDYQFELLDAVSEAIRDAAGAPVTLTTATICIPGSTSTWLDLPGPVRSVAAVTLDESALTADGYRVWPDRLWRRGGWGGPEVPVTITYTLGVEVVPADVVQLACELVILAASSEAVDPRIASEGVDDYRVTYRDGRVSAVELPEGTRAMLRARFSGGVSTVGVR